MLGLAQLRERHRKAQLFFDRRVTIAAKSMSRASERLAQIAYVLDDIEQDLGVERTTNVRDAPKQCQPPPLPKQKAAPTGPRTSYAKPKQSTQSSSASSSSGPPTKAPPTIPPKAGPPCPPIRARFEGWCWKCNKTIYPGEWISKEPGGMWKHHACHSSGN